MLITVTLNSVAQEADTSDKETEKAERDSTKSKRKRWNQENTIYKPILGLGTGILNYFGEVNNNGRTNPVINNYGFQFNVIKNFSPSFGVRFDVTYGKITANERSEKRNLNFSTDLITFAVHGTYNFAGILPPKRFLNPFISVGIGAVNFSSKGDLESADGQTYYYWGDAIRALPEQDENASTSDYLRHDYAYETDLRKANLDSLGDYSEFAITIPFTFGFHFKVSPRSAIRLSSTFSYTFTDLIDNVSDKSLGDRKGNAANDMFMFTSVSYHFDFFSTKKKKISKYDDTEFFSLEGDSDGDGVSDLADNCPDSPKGGVVDEKGCPLDSDGDGVYDYLDEESNTDTLLNVNSSGVGLTDDMIVYTEDDTLATLRAKMFEVYPDLAETYRNSKKGNNEISAVNGSMGENPYDIFDADGSGEISVKEVYQAIDLFFEGELDVDANFITGLIDYFFDQ